MSTVTNSPAKLHISLNVSDLARSIAFYRTLFGCEPARQHRDYAKFEVDQPPLVLSLIPAPVSPGGTLNHVGLRVSTPETLIEMQRRLESGGFSTQREEGVQCCHSQQTKFWVNDPDRTLWEIYMLVETGDDDDEEAHPSHQRPVTSAQRPHAFANSSAPAVKSSWQHHLTDDAITRVPHDSNSLHEVLLEGSANLHPDRFDLRELLRDAHRALRPGGVIRIHGLSADAELANRSPSLPGPAAAVQYVPTHREVAQALESAGFARLFFERLSEQTHFRVDDIGLRELLLAARKPGHRPQLAKHRVIYLGPLGSVTDDFGNTFVRGQTVGVNVQDWQALSASEVAGQFLFLAP